MVKTYVNLVGDKTSNWITKYNNLINQVGDLALLATPDDSSIVGAINSMYLVVGTDVQGWDSDLDVYAANPLKAHEIVEIQNINLATISSTQWGYLGTLNQSLNDSDQVTFKKLTVSSGNPSIDLIDSNDNYSFRVTTDGDVAQLVALDSIGTAIAPGYSLGLGSTGVISQTWSISDSDILTLSANRLISTKKVVSTSDSGFVVDNITPQITLLAAGTDPLSNHAVITLDTSAFKIQTFDSDHNLVSTDYNIDRDSTGALSHTWYIQDSEQFGIRPEGAGTGILNFADSFTSGVVLNTFGSTFYQRLASAGPNSAAIQGYHGTTNVINIQTDGDIVNLNGSYGTISDRIFKENIIVAGSQWDDILALEFKNYNLKSDPDKKQLLGLIAQDVEKTSPGLVSENPDGTKNVKHSILFLKATAALQEALHKIEELEDRIDVLEQKK